MVTQSEGEGLTTPPNGMLEGDEKMVYYEGGASRHNSGSSTESRSPSSGSEVRSGLVIGIRGRSTFYNFELNSWLDKIQPSIMISCTKSNPSLRTGAVVIAPCRIKWCILMDHTINQNFSTDL